MDKYFKSVRHIEPHYQAFIGGEHYTIVLNEDDPVKTITESPDRVPLAIYGWEKVSEQEFLCALQKVNTMIQENES